MGGNTHSLPRTAMIPLRANQSKGTKTHGHLAVVDVIRACLSIVHNMSGRPNWLPPFERGLAVVAWFHRTLFAILGYGGDPSMLDTWLCSHGLAWWFGYPTRLDSRGCSACLCVLFNPFPQKQRSTNMKDAWILSFWEQRRIWSPGGCSSVYGNVPCHGARFFGRASCDWPFLRMT